MKTTVQARLDPGSRKQLEQLQRRLGWSTSRVLREGIRLLSACHTGQGRKKIIGLGEFSSGISDLGSNKAHLEGLGR